MNLAFLVVLLSGGAVPVSAPSEPPADPNAGRYFRTPDGGYLRTPDGGYILQPAS